MDLTALAKAAARVAEAAEAAAAQSGGIPTPLAPPDPAAEAAFKEAMHGPQEVGGADRTAAAPGAEPGLRTVSAGDDLDVPESLGVYGDIYKVLGKEHLSHGDLFRVQVMAGLASVDAQRNSAAVNSMDQGLKTLLKDSG